MNRIWANRVIAGTKVWAEVPKARKDAVFAELQGRVISGEITKERLAELTGQELST